MTERATGGVLHLVATPIGNLEDITYRAVRVLGEAEVVAAEDTRTTSLLLRHYGIRPARLVSLHEHNEESRTAELLNLLRGGGTVAVVSDAGTPAISDPGYRLVVAAAAAGVAIRPIPGASAVLAALIASALPTERFEFLGFPPRERGRRRQLFGSLARSLSTLVFYEAPTRVAATLVDLEEALGGDRRASLGRELTKLYEEHHRATLAELGEHYRERPPRGECTLVVAGATAADAAIPAEDLEDRVRALLATGLGARDVAARLVVTTGLPRRQLYQLALSLRRARS